MSLLRPKKLLGQLLLWVLLAMLLAQGLSWWIMSNAHHKVIAGNAQRNMLQQLVSVVVLLEASPIELHPKILSVWRRPDVKYRLLTSPQVTAAVSDSEVRLAAQLTHWFQQQGLNPTVYLRLDMGDNATADNAGRLPPPGLPPPHPATLSESTHLPQNLLAPHPAAIDSLQVAISLSNGLWLQFVASAPPVPPLAARQSIIFVLLASVLVMTVLIWRLRLITQPLASLAQAASEIGRGENPVPLPEKGPDDIRLTIAAFNQMQGRVERYVSERTRMLAALSHDMRTPITSMRLRLEMMEESELRVKLLHTLDEMAQMSEDTLTFIRESGDAEQKQTLDLVSLINSICDDLNDMGQSVSTEVHGEQLLVCKPVSLMRALRNVIENAVKYGNTAHVSMAFEPPNIVIEVQDQGPGVNPEQMQRVFEPFFRGEASRNRKTGGVGLGLSIARQIVVNHGGDIQLENTDAGLKVIIVLPQR